MSSNRTKGIIKQKINIRRTNSRKETSTIKANMIKMITGEISMIGKINMREEIDIAKHKNMIKYKKMIGETNMKLLKGGRLCDAIRMRTNTFGTRMVLRRTDRNINTNCRKCKDKPETLGHILGQCIHTKDARIRRHDQIKNFVAEKAARRYTVFTEPTINVRGELKKPDLVIKRNEEVIVADVTVRYENRGYLRDAAKEKEDKYRTTANTLVERIDGATEGRVWPIVVGSRGALPEKTKGILKKLGLTKGDMVTVSMLSLRSSIEIANAFIDDN